MKQQNYNCTIHANITAGEAFERISEVYNWWTTNFEGSAANLNDVFTVRFGDTFVTFKITEVIPDKKIVWLVTDSSIPSLKDKQEWTNMQIEWVVTPENNKTQVSMTHIGLVPEVECYDMCEKGWNFYTGVSLLKLLNEGKGLPDTPHKEREKIIA